MTIHGIIRNLSGFDGDLDGDLDVTGNSMISGQLVVDGVITTNANVVQDGSALPETEAPENWIYGRNGRWAYGIDVANTVKARDYVPIIQSGIYAFDDGVTTIDSATLTSAAQGGFATAMIGSTLSGTGIPLGTTVSAVGSATSLTMSAVATANGTGVRVNVVGSGVADVMYLKHRGARPCTVGIGVTPPDGAHFLQVSAPAAEPAMGTASLSVGASQTASPVVKDD